MSQADADRNLLFGILALQMDFITRDALIAAMGAWVLDKATPLDEVLVHQAALAAGHRDLLVPLVRAHIRRHGDDPGRSLAATGPFDQVRRELETVADDVEVHAGLARLAAAGTEPDDHPDRLAACAGESASAGGRFRLLRFHDRGGLGEVWVARDEELRREVALKRLRDEHADDAQRRARFLVEAEITGNLEHPGIVPVYALGHHDDGRPFYAMRFIRGDSLQHTIAQFHRAGSGPREPGERVLELRRLLGRFLDVCNALAYAHCRGVLHRDLKPGNIMLGRFGETLVVDWGLAKDVGRPDVAGPDAEPTLTPGSGGEVKPTVMGARVGTPAYMSPEQAAGRLDALGPASDVYSLGATLYCLLTGKPPFEGRDLAGLLREVERGGFAPPRTVDPEIDRGLDAICLKAMAQTPGDRYATPRMLADDLEHWLADEPVSALPETSGRRLSRWARRNRAWTRAGAATLVIIAAFSILMAAILRTSWWQERRARKDADDQRTIALESLRVEKEALRASGSLSARLEMDRGRILCDQYRIPEGMLWMARALRTAPVDDPLLQAAIRSNLAMWGREIVTLEDNSLLRNNGVVHALAFSPDGTMAVTGMLGGAVQLWDARGGAPIGARLSHGQRTPPGWINAVAFDPTGRLILSGGDDGSARLWRAADGSPIGQPMRHDGRVFSVAFSPDGRTIVTGSGDRTARVWSAKDASQIGKPIVHDGDVNLVTVSPDGKLLLTACYSDSTLHLWNLADGSEAGKPISNVPVESAAFSPDGRRFVTGARGGIAQLWSTMDRTPVGHPMIHRGWVTAVAFSPDGETILTGTDDGTVRFWDASDAAPRFRTLFGRHTVLALGFDGRDKAILSGDVESIARWDGIGLRPEGRRFCPGHGASLSPDGRVVLVDAYPVAQLRGMKDGSPIGTPMRYGPGGTFLIQVGLDRSGTRVLTAFGKDARIWDAADGSPIAVVKHAENLRAAAISPGGKFAATGFSRTVSVWRTDDGKPVGKPLSLGGSIQALEFSPDGRTLLIGVYPGTARLWDVETRELLGIELTAGRGGGGGPSTASASARMGVSWPWRAMISSSSGIGRAGRGSASWRRVTAAYGTSSSAPTGGGW